MHVLHDKTGPPKGLAEKKSTAQSAVNPVVRDYLKHTFLPHVTWHKESNHVPKRLVESNGELDDETVSVRIDLGYRYGEATIVRDFSTFAYVYSPAVSWEQSFYIHGSMPWVEDYEIQLHVLMVVLRSYPPLMQLISRQIDCMQEVTALQSLELQLEYFATPAKFVGCDGLLAA